jgi:hypothetical protein
METTDFDQIASLGWCDSILLQLEWSEDSPSVCLKVRLFHKTGSRLVWLQCRWVYGMDVRLDAAGLRAGPPMAWEVIFERLSDRYKVTFDFASAGDVMITCTEMCLTEEPPALSTQSPVPPGDAE